MTFPHSGVSRRRQAVKKLLKPRPVPRSKICRAPRPGQKCDGCGKGRLDYDGLLQLSCPACGQVAAGGGFT